MLRCREISKLVSESMERDLPLRRRLEVRMHLMMCRMCSGFARQVRLLRLAARENPERLGPDETAPEAKLPEKARERIKAALRNGDG
jgi:putative zinc finger protein